MSSPLISRLGRVIAGAILLSPPTLVMFEAHLLAQTSSSVASNIISSPSNALIDRNLFFEDPEIDSPQLSPDGQYLAFRKSVNGVMK